MGVKSVQKLVIRVLIGAGIFVVIKSNSAHYVAALLSARCEYNQRRRAMYVDLRFSQRHFLMTAL